MGKPSRRFTQLGDDCAGTIRMQYQPQDRRHGQLMIDKVLGCKIFRIDLMRETKTVRSKGSK